MKNLAAKFVHAYASVQVELHGQYSIERVAELHAYERKHSTRQCLASLLATPLPCLTMIVFTDLVPLNAPQEGYSNGIVLWARTFLVAFVLTATLLAQCRQFVPGLPCSNRAIIVISAAVSLWSTTFNVLFAHMVGFPVPFMFISSSPAFCFALAVIGTMQWGKLVRESKPLQQALVAFAKVTVVQFTLTFVYPAFNYLFIQQSGLKQTAVAMVLPVMKLLAKNAISLVLNDKLEDFKPEIVIINVEVFHALFVSYCMQSSSWTTTIVLTCTDFIQAWFGLRDMDVLLKKTDMLEAKLRTTTLEVRSSIGMTPAPLSRIERALFFVRSDLLVRSHASVRIRPEELRPQVLARHSSYPPRPTHYDRRRQDYRCKAVVYNLSRTENGVLHLAEFMLLVELVEVVIPVIYTVYLTAMFFLPNRAYYPQLARMDSHSLLSSIGSTFAYACMEFLSFILISTVLRRKLQLSPVHQLAFVIQTQWSFVQSKMILWVVFAVHISLEHFGYDYSFRFAWLRNP